MRVLVTGANGFVGTALCTALQARAVACTAATRQNVGNVGPATNWSQVLQGCDVVVHLAGLAHQPVGGDISALHATNVAGSVHLARQAAAAGVRRFVFLSSIKAWGEVSLPGAAARESDDCHPQDAYGHSKREAEQALQQLARETGMEVVIIRPPLVYGPHAKANFALLMRTVLRGWPLPFGAVRNARSFVALDNLVDFVICCAQHPAAANQIFHVSDGADLSTAELVKGIAHAANVSTRLLPVPAGVLRAAAWMIGKSDVLQRLTANLQVDISKARTLLGWTPPLTVEQGLRQAMAGMERP